MRRKIWIAAPTALVLIAGSALWVSAAESDVADRACADIVQGEAEFFPATETVTGVPQSGATNGRLVFNEVLGAPTCPDVQYGLVALSENPAGGVPTVLASQVVPGDGISREIQFDLAQFPDDPTRATVCIYLYTMGTSETSTTTPSNGNPHSQTISATGLELIDRAPDGTGDAPYCNIAGEGSGGRTYN